MRERQLVCQARERLVVTAALLHQLHEQLRAGRLRPAQADAACGLVAVQLDQALESIEAARDRLWSTPLPPRPIAPRAGFDASRRDVARPAS